MNSNIFIQILVQVDSFRNDLRSNKEEFYKMMEVASNLLKNNNDALQNWYDYCVAYMMGKLAIKMEEMMAAGVDPMHSSLTHEIVKDIKEIEAMYQKCEQSWNNAVSSEIETLTN